MKGMRIGIIGCGNMGEAILRRLRAMRVRHLSCMVSELDPAKRKRIKRSYRVKVADDNSALARGSDVILLAVKPRDIDEALCELSCANLRSKLIISIAAGVSTRRIERLLGQKVPVVRAMPNMPAIVGAAISAICPGRYARPSHMRSAKALLSSVGEVIEVREGLMDAVTAVSGSGPAYFFYLAECLREAAKDLGLGEAEAATLALKTAFGSARVLGKVGESPEALRAKVTSKGGTTEAAFRVLESKKFKDIVKLAVKAARDRARELDRGEAHVRTR